MSSDSIKFCILPLGKFPQYKAGTLPYQSAALGEKIKLSLRISKKIPSAPLSLSWKVKIWITYITWPMLA
jgi:hypothetical protein